MNTWALLFAAVLALAATAHADKKIVCYFGSWAVYRPGNGKFEISHIDPSLCTHLIYSFIGLGDNGEIRVLDSWQDLPDNWGKDGFGNFNKLRNQSPGTKTLIAIGGWNEGSTKYSKMANDPAIRARFVKNVVAFLDKYNFDGFDLDWEYPNQRGGVEADKQGFVELCKELKKAFEPRGYLLTAAVGAAETSASKSYKIREMSKYLDFINLMSYDFHGAWESNTGINAPLYPAKRESGDVRKFNVEAAIKYWLAQGCPAEKLILGVPFYGRAFTLANPSNNQVGAPTTGPGTAGPFTREAGMLGYNEICEMLASGGWTIKRDPEQRVPYAYKGNQWFGYDDVESVKEKAEFVNKLGLGGAMLWSIETDDFRGTCGTKYPLLKTLNNVLRNGAPVPTSKPRPTAHPTPAPTPEPTSAPPADGICTKEGYVVDKKDCSVFYLCQIVNGAFETFRFQCGAGLGFDTRISACNFKNLVPECN